MKTVYLFPPNYAAINRAFKVRGKPVIFAFGDTIYNPGRINVSPQLLVHEAVHSRQQGNDPEGWWARYIGDKQFRLEQEIPAHQAEARCAPHMADVIAQRLASPLYGNLIDFASARALLAADESASTASNGNAWQPPGSSTVTAI